MNKVRFEFEKSEPISIGSFGGNNVLVQPYIPYQMKLLLTSRYLTTYFLSDEGETELFLTKYNYLGAERELMLGVIDEFTNIMIFDKDDNVVLNLDDFGRSQLWVDIKSSILNYDELISDIYILVSSVKEEKYEKNSFRQALNDASNTIFKFIEGLSNIEMTEEGFSKIAQEISKVGEVLKDSPVSAIIEDSKRK